MRHVPLRAATALLLTMATLLASTAFAAPDAPQLQKMAARLAPVDIRVDLSTLPESERQALARIIQAAQILDGVFLRQVSARNESRLMLLVNDTSALGKARLDYFMINKGPWSALDANAPFLPGVEPKPPQANFYPADATRAEVDAWMNTLPQAEKDVATGFFTTIRRNPSGKLVAIPYSQEYQGELMEMAKLLRDAAALTKQPTLKAFLEKRAAAFISNDYYESDVAWMELNASIEPTIGPYEVYEDEWFNFKAAFEAFITVTDFDETKKLEKFSGELQELENHLPIDPKFRRAKLGGYSPIRVVNVVYNSGDANHDVQTAAFNLPNDERVVTEKGSKRTMLKNFQQAKFDKVLLPIADVTIVSADRSLVAFEPFFTHVLMHELMHGLGPQAIKVGGRDTTVRQELKELNGPLEEAKADVSGLWALQQLMDKGVLDKKLERSMYTTFLASTFRTLRFGLTQTHAKGIAMQVNNLFDHGAIKVAADGRVSIDVPKAKKAVTDLTHQIMTIQATGDYAAADALLKKRVVVRPEMQKLLDRLGEVPVDIAPKPLTAMELIHSTEPATK
jgi:peptidase M49-like protein